MILTIDETRYDDAHERDCARVAALLSGSGPHSRATVSDQLKMTSTTTSRVVGDLIDRGLVAEQAGVKTGRGRPAIQIALNLQKLGGTIIHVSSRALLGFLLDLGGNVLERRIVDIPATADNAYMAVEMRRLVQALIGKCPPGMHHLGTSVSVSGVVDVRNRKWLIASRWPHIRSLDLGTALESVTPVVLVCRHLDAELDARILREPAYRAGSTLLLHWGWGIGLSYSVDGHPLAQAGGPFGEIGHWRFNMLEERKCGCGNHGCLETGAALWALLPHLRDVWPHLSDEEEPLAEQLADLLLIEMAEPAMAINLMARSLANVCRLLFPTRVIITGPFVANSAVWNAFVTAFQSEGVMGSLELPELIADKFSQEYAIHGALRPLLDMGLEAFLHETRRVA
jgi:predicted NBD/HSP70 family sugar kinase